MIIDISKYRLTKVSKNDTLDKSSLQAIKDVLSEDDYLDFLEGCLDLYTFNILDNDIQDIITGFYGLKDERA